jgi:hypothetical protein
LAMTMRPWGNAQNGQGECIEWVVGTLLWLFRPVYFKLAKDIHPLAAATPRFGGRCCWPTNPATASAGTNCAWSVKITIPGANTPLNNPPYGANAPEWPQQVWT